MEPGSPAPHGAASPNPGRRSVGPVGGLPRKAAAAPSPPTAPTPPPDTHRRTTDVYIEGAFRPRPTHSNLAAPRDPDQPLRAPPTPRGTARKIRENCVSRHSFLLARPTSLFRPDSDLTSPRLTRQSTRRPSNQTPPRESPPMADDMADDMADKGERSPEPAGLVQLFGSTWFNKEGSTSSMNSAADPPGAQPTQPARPRSP